MGPQSLHWLSGFLEMVSEAASGSASHLKSGNDDYSSLTGLLRKFYGFLCVQWLEVLGNICYSGDLFLRLKYIQSHAPWIYMGLAY